MPISQCPSMSMSCVGVVRGVGGNKRMRLSRLEFEGAEVLTGQVL